jgi:hypothetical protein
MEVHVDDSDDDCGDTYKGDRVSKSENDPESQQEFNHEDSV